MRLPDTADVGAEAFDSSAQGAKLPTPHRKADGAVPPSHDPDGDRVLLISVKPHYAEAILEGSKTVELRRTRPTLPRGALVLLYSSTPTRAVVGWAKLTRVRAGTPAEIWRAVGDSAAVDAATFDAYFEGAEAAYALELNTVVEAARPVPLNVIRSIGVQPPQSWRYLPLRLSHQILTSAVD